MNGESNNRLSLGQFILLVSSISLSEGLYIHNQIGFGSYWVPPAPGPDGAKVSLIYNLETLIFSMDRYLLDINSIIYI